MTDPFHATTEGEGGNPLSEGLGDAGRHAAELAAAAAMAMQMWTRARDQREQARMVDDQRASDAARGQLRADQAAARLAWAPALEPEFARSATAADAMGAWSAAQPWVDYDPSAADASQRAEARLTELHPDLMEQYRAYRQEEMVPPAAMLEAGRTVSAWDWQDVLDPAKRQDMGVDETLRAWGAARPWAAAAPQPEGQWSPRSEEAAQAMGEAEARLRTLRPVAMAGYDEARSMGVEPLEAMQAAAPELRQQVWQDEIAVRGRLDSGEADADRTVAQQQRSEAAHDLAQPDLRSTPGVDERAVGATQGANHHELADARGAQAESLVGKAFPETIHTALAARGAAAPAPAARLTRSAAPSSGRRR
jgi:hypothetical protein